MGILHLIVLALATWRMSSLIATEKGPYNILGRLRKLSGVTYDKNNGSYYPTNTLSELVLCIWCLSPWIAAILVILYYFFGVTVVWVCLPFALSAAAIIVDKYT